MLAILTTKLGLGAIAVALVLAVIGVQTARLAHAKADLDKLRAADKAAAADAKIHEAKAAAISVEASQQVAASRDRVRTVTKTLIEKVPVYVPASADRDCIVPRGFVQLHDAAAAGLPSPAGGPDQAPSGVPLSTVAATVAANYGIAYDWRAEAIGWRDWYKAQAAAAAAP